MRVVWGEIWEKRSMIHFMVDWENIQHNGLQGSQYLCPTDSVTIFYSDVCNRIEQGELQNLLHSGCELQICKLVRASKNALDFYISSRIGALFGSGYRGQVAIVSRDKGFQAVQDYWTHCVKPRRKIIISPSLETCIVAMGEVSERQKNIKRALQVVDLEREFQKYDGKQYICREAMRLFADVAYQDRMEQIMALMQYKSGQNRELYLQALKQFGKKDGLEIYHRVKQWRAAQQQAQ